MLPQVTPQGEAPVTLVAAECFFTRVDKLMSLQLTFLIEKLVTLFTVVRFLTHAHVNSTLMPRKAIFGAEPAITLFTDVGLLRRVARIPRFYLSFRLS